MGHSDTELFCLFGSRNRPNWLAFWAQQPKNVHFSNVRSSSQRIFPLENRALRLSDSNHQLTSPCKQHIEKQRMGSFKENDGRAQKRLFHFSDSLSSVVGHEVLKARYATLCVWPLCVQSKHRHTQSFDNFALDASLATARPEIYKGLAKNASSNTFLSICAQWSSMTSESSSNITSSRSRRWTSIGTVDPLHRASYHLDNYNASVLKAQAAGTIRFFHSAIEFLLYGWSPKR